jgi:hypothetical protein
MIFRAISSVGLEHYLDRVGVTGSNPVLPTLLERELFFNQLIHDVLFFNWPTDFQVKVCHDNPDKWD